jgi:phenylpyruvate tautomerase PptA (4-oxalocrotonate tautomerase family)
MPLVRVSVSESVLPSERAAIAEAIYQAMRATIDIPEGDKFILVTPHGPDELFFDPHFMGVNRGGAWMLVQIFLSQGRSVEKKQALYAAIARGLKDAVGIASDDVMIVLTENSYVDWSFGRGEAQFVLNPPSWVQQATEGK